MVLDTLADWRKSIVTSLAAARPIPRFFHGGLLADEQEINSMTGARFVSVQVLSGIAYTYSNPGDIRLFL